MIRIDCRWFKTLIYLDKRNLTVQVNSSPGTCDVNTLTSSILVMSKCLRSFNSKENRPHAIKPLNRNEIELKIEPELDQLLIEGDTLTLTCRFKKLPDNKKTLKQTHIFLKTKLNWFMLQKSSGKSLALKPTQMNSNDKFFVSIFQAIFKFEEEKIIESKLIIKRTNTGENSGKYFCSTENSNQMNLYNNLNTSHVDIQVSCIIIVINYWQRSRMYWRVGHKELEGCFFSFSFFNNVYFLQKFCGLKPELEIRVYCSERLLVLYWWVVRRWVSISKLFQYFQ